MDLSVSVRQANGADIPAIMNLDRQSSSAAHWSQQQYEGLFLTPGSQSRFERFALVVEDDSKALIAFLVARRVEAEWELENIVVAETARRGGVGTRLLRELIAHARAGGSGIFLEVRGSNQSARALYGKLGFAETGLRKSYYSDPPEDAILCQLSLY